MKYEELYRYTGEIGRYQLAVFAAVFLFIMYITDSIQMVFVGGEMAHWCRVRELEHLPYAVQKNVAIPSETQEDGSIEYSSCRMYAFNYSIYNESDFLSWNRKPMVTNSTDVVACTEWMYDQSTFTSTIVSRFNLVCGLEFLNQLTTSAYMAGLLIGAFTSGFFSDRFGRKKTMISFNVIKLCGNIMSTFASNYAVFFVGRFVIGIGINGYYLAGYVLVMELVGPEYRSLLGSGIQMAFSVGFMLQPLLAYFLRDDFRYQLASSSPGLLFPFIMLFFIPESPRWLTVHGKYDEALKLMKRICEVNGKELPEDFDPSQFDMIELDSSVGHKNCFALMTSSVLRLRTIVLGFSWFTCSVIYFALSLNTGTLSGNIYINTFIAGAVEIPAYITGIYMMNWRPLGRRWSALLTFCGAGISCFLCIPIILYTDVPAVATALSMLGKAFITVAFAVIYVFTSEIYPTEIRHLGLGTGTVCARLSSMTAAYMGGPLMAVWKPLPSLIFGIFGTVSGLSFVLLPETLGDPLFDTIAQTEESHQLKQKAKQIDSQRMTII